MTEKEARLILRDINDYVHDMFDFGYVRYHTLMSGIEDILKKHKGS